MKQFIAEHLTCRFTVFGLVALLSIFALAAALFSEVTLGLEPCILCIYQRIPFVIGAILGVAGLLLREKAGVSSALLGVISLNFFINSGIAFYHTGVEQKWWKSQVEGCAVPNFGSEPQSILENILSAPTANCAEIPWQDPILGLSMANYNIALCLGISIMCLTSIIYRKSFA